MTDSRRYPDRPFLAVSAAIFHEGRVLIVRRAKPPAGIHTLPGGVVETGETLIEAVRREVAEETGLLIEPLALAGFREVITRDGDKKVSRHFVILPFAARLTGGELRLSDELDEARWCAPAELAGLKTTDGLAETVAAAEAHLARHR